MSLHSTSRGSLQEVFTQELHEIVETYFEEEIVIEGEYATEETMKQWGFSEHLGLQYTAGCTLNPAGFCGTFCYSKEAYSSDQEVLLRRPDQVHEVVGGSVGI